MNNKKLNRLILLCSEIRQNRFPNAASFVKQINQLSEEDSRYTSISKKTFYRDRDELVHDFGAPIVYNTKERGFEFSHGGWELEIPWLEQPEIVDVALAGKIANDILPAPLKNRITTLQNQILTRHTADFFDSSLLDSFIINWGHQKYLNQEVFDTVFKAWQNRRILGLNYKKPNGNILEYKIEPHVLIFNGNTWYIVGKKLPENRRRTFALHRINSATLLKMKFSNDRDIIKDVKENGPYYDPDLKDTVIICSGNAAVLAQENYSQNCITIMNDGKVKVKIPEIRHYDLINHILVSRGEVIAEDKSIMEEVQKICKSFESI